MTDQEPPDWNQMYENCPEEEHNHCGECAKVLMLPSIQEIIQSEMEWRAQFEDWQTRERIRVCEDCYNQMRDE